MKYKNVRILIHLKDTRNPKRLANPCAWSAIVEIDKIEEKDYSGFQSIKTMLNLLAETNP
jgi:hypothetical protein